MEKLWLFTVNEADRLCCLLARDEKCAVAVFEEAKMLHNLGGGCTVKFLRGPFEVHFSTVAEIAICTKAGHIVWSLLCGRFSNEETSVHRAEELFAAFPWLRCEVDKLSEWYGELYVTVHAVDARSTHAVGWVEQASQLKVMKSCVFCRPGCPGRLVRLALKQDIHLVEQNCTIAGRKLVRFANIVNLI